MQIQALFKKTGAAAPAKKGTSSTKVVKPSGTKQTKVNVVDRCSSSAAHIGSQAACKRSLFGISMGA